MNPKVATLATLGREVAMPALVLAWIGTSGLAGVDHSRAAPTIDRLAPSLAAHVKFNDGKLADSKSTDRLPSGASVPLVFPPASDLSLADVTAAVTFSAALPPAPRSTPPIVTASLGETSQLFSSEAPPEPAATTDAAGPKLASLETGDVEQFTPASPKAASIEVFDECFAVDVCVDRYLWALYQRTPKEDTVKVEEKRQVTVKRKGKTVMVTRTFTRRVDQDFGWKDPHAAEKAGMSMADYVIGGMDKEFKLKLFHMLHFAEEAGLQPGITSAFRDDYRQSIASGLKAASDRSYHGGSLRGGYGHGMAADVVSVNGATRAQRLAASQAFWKWIDANGKNFGIGRPYLDRDPPHVGPVDGKEYAAKRPGAKSRQAGSAAKPGQRAAAKRIRTAGS